MNRSGSSRDYGVDKTHVLPLAAAAAGIGQNTSFMIDAVIVLALGSFLSFKGYGQADHRDFPNSGAARFVEVGLLLERRETGVDHRAPRAETEERSHVEINQSVRERRIQAG